MPSYTSSSKGWSATRAILALLLAFAVTGAGLEAIAHVGLHRISRIGSRIWREYAAALQIRPIGLNGKPSMLVTGNSLLLEGVDFPNLQQRLAGRWDVERYVVEQTNYLDWEFGLRRLLDEGARPTHLVMVLNTAQLISNETRAEIFANLQMRLRDLPQVAEQAHLSNTEESTYAFANLSSWFGWRSEIRKVLLLRALPGTEDFLVLLQGSGATLPPDHVVEERLVPRLKALKEICEPYGTQLTIVVPPTLDTGSRIAGAMAASRAAGVRLLKPSQKHELPKSMYRDGYHLSEEGAAVFTEQLAEALQEAITP